jgi:teichuronic acid biosynthesis glycosyltransferase TuaC
MDKLSVLVLSHMYPSTFNEIAGIFVHEQVKELIRQGCKVRVICPVPWSPFPINRLRAKWKTYSRIPPQDVWNEVEVYYPRFLVYPKAMLFASSGEWMYRGIKDLVAKIYQDFFFDIIHAHVALPDGFSAMRLKKKYYKPLVVTIHGQDLQVTLHRNDRCKKALMKVFEIADRIIVVSTKLNRIARAEIGFEDKIRIVNNGVDPKKLKSKENGWTFNHSGCKTILSVSNLVNSKGIDLNLMAVSKLIEKHPRLKYVVIGDGPERKRLVGLVANLGVDSQVEFIGRLSHEKVMKYMAEIEIFSLPSWLEGFGVVYLEAMAHGKPIIACQGEGIEDVITHGETGLLVEPKNVESLVEAIDFLLSNPEKAKSIGERARNLVLEKYTWEKNAEKTIEVYREVLNA